MGELLYSSTGAAWAGDTGRDTLSAAAVLSSSFPAGKETISECVLLLLGRTDTEKELRGIVPAGESGEGQDLLLVGSMLVRCVIASAE